MPAPTARVLCLLTHFQIWRNNRGRISEGISETARIAQHHSRFRHSFHQE
jgi:hypothetical protein